MKSTQIALVIKDSTDPRAAEFGKLLGRVQNTEVFLVSAAGGQWMRLDSQGLMGPPLVEQARPKYVEALLVHASDWDSSFPTVKAQLLEGIGRIFVFNGPGDPPRKEDAVRILRPTSPFTISDRDARQFVAYATDISAALPACCAYPAQTLVAVDILCQGYRAAHGDSSLPGLERLNADRIVALRKKSKQTEDETWWLKGLQLTNLSELEQRLQGENVPSGEVVQVCSTIADAQTAIKGIGPRGNLPIEMVTAEERKALTAVVKLHDLVRGLLE